MLTASLAAVAAENAEKEMTFTVDAGRKDCFYQAVRIGEIIDLEYQVKSGWKIIVWPVEPVMYNHNYSAQVIDGGHGELDINFSLNEPSGRILIADIKKPDNTHRHKAIVDGDYALCFDNTISRFNKKTVFLELIVENEDDDDGGANNNWPSQLDAMSGAEYYEIKVEDILSAINKIHGHLSKARQTQDILRTFEARDRNVAEGNNSRVQVWSMLQIVGMLLVGGLQVFLVRSLFETDSSRKTIWSWLKP